MDASVALTDPATSSDSELDDDQLTPLTDKQAAKHKFPPGCLVQVSLHGGNNKNSNNNDKEFNPLLRQVSHVFCGEVDGVFIDCEADGKPFVYRVSVHYPVLPSLLHVEHGSSTAAPTVTSTLTRKIQMIVPPAMLQYAPGCNVWWWNPLLASNHASSSSSDAAAGRKEPSKSNRHVEWLPAVVMGSHLAATTAGVFLRRDFDKTTTITTVHYSLQVLGQPPEQCVMVHGVAAPWVAFRDQHQTIVPSIRVQELAKAIQAAAQADAMQKQLQSQAVAAKHEQNQQEPKQELAAAAPANVTVEGAVVNQENTTIYTRSWEEGRKQEDITAAVLYQDECEDRGLSDIDYKPEGLEKEVAPVNENKPKDERVTQLLDAHENAEDHRNLVTRKPEQEEGVAKMDEHKGETKAWEGRGGENSRKRPVAEQADDTVASRAFKIARKDSDRYKATSITSAANSSSSDSDREYDLFPRRWVRPKSKTPAVQSQDATAAAVTREQVIPKRMAAPKVSSSTANGGATESILLQGPIPRKSPAPKAQVGPANEGAVASAQRKLHSVEPDRVLSSPMAQKLPPREERMLPSPPCRQVNASPNEKETSLKALEFVISGRFGYPLVRDALIGHRGSTHQAFTRHHGFIVQIDGKMVPTHRPDYVYPGKHDLCAFLKGADLFALFQARKALEALLLRATHRQLRPYLLASLGWLNSSHRQVGGGGKGESDIVNTRDPFADHISTEEAAYVATHWVGIQVTTGVNQVVFQRDLEQLKRDHPDCRIEMVADPPSYKDGPRAPPHVAIVSDSHTKAYLCCTEVTELAIRAG